MELLSGIDNKWTTLTNGNVLIGSDVVPAENAKLSVRGAIQIISQDFPLYLLNK